MHRPCFFPLFLSLTTLIILAPPPLAAQTPILSEGFSTSSGGQGTQYQTGHTVWHSGHIIDWTKTTGDGHAVFIDGNTAVSLYSGSPDGGTQPDTLTYNSGIAANDAGASYRVAFEAGPSVWAHHSQVTTAEDGLVFEILRGDGSVLASHEHLPGAWQGSQALSPSEFTYTGDGSGAVVVRLRTVRTGSNTFAGAIDNIRVYPADSPAPYTVCAAGCPHATIRAAALAAASGDTITVGPGTYYGDVSVNAKEIRIEGEDAATTIIDSQQSNRGFRIDQGAVVHLSGLTITNGLSPGGNSHGGGVFIRGESQVSLTDCVVDGNTAKSRGGAIDIVGAGTVLTLERTTLSNNTAVNDGGAINCRVGCRVTVAGSTVSNNTATYGSAFYLRNDARLEVSGTTIDGSCHITDADLVDSGGNSDRDGCFPVTPSSIASKYFEEQGDMPGLSIAVAKEGKLVYKEGFGNERGAPMIAENPLRIGSVSKTITAVAVMKLIEEQRTWGASNVAFSLESKVFGPDGILQTDPANYVRLDFVDITVDHLLTQRSGLPSHSLLGQGEKSDDEVIAWFLEGNFPDTSFSPPDTQHTYSNANYIILGRVIEQVTGESYEAHVRGLLGGHGIADIALATGSAIGRLKGAGAWQMSTVDLVRFCLAVDGLHTKPEILSEAYRNQMLTPPTGQTYARGWITNGSRYFHNGSVNGGSAFLLVVPEKNLCLAAAVNEGGRHKTLNSGLLSPIAETVTSWPDHDLFNP